MNAILSTLTLGELIKRATTMHADGMPLDTPVLVQIPEDLSGWTQYKFETTTSYGAREERSEWRALPAFFPVKAKVHEQDALVIFIDY